MQMTLDADSGVNLIRSYADDAVRIGEKLLHRSLIVTADQLIEPWDPNDLETLFALKADVVLRGEAGAQGFPPASVRAAFAARGIALESMTLGAACRTFNILVQEGRRVAAALILKK